ncbi:hypothetical protein GXP67_31980 [Rhodocytophaga rosea]|uniref:Ig-like domain-containing protein n=1 Tax=Rhodocytophaga rosea TaxID=2704465 RepID=A0A6C0GS94_9BACT|nr:hypothetical protein [Rhodocytophaga rosea]QHT70939.1 hypothetical protein GXP67_31980 [Rhodocytophaga rosea]
MIHIILRLLKRLSIGLYSRYTLWLLSFLLGSSLLQSPLYAQCPTCPSGATIISSNQSNLNINSGAVVCINAGITVTSISLNGGTLYNNGTVTGNVNFNSGSTIYNCNTFTPTNGMDINGPFHNYGTLTQPAGSNVSINSNGNFINYPGSISTFVSLSINSSILISSPITVNGNLTVNSGVTVSGPSGSCNSIAISGSFSNNGTFTNNVTVNKGASPNNGSIPASSINSTATTPVINTQPANTSACAGSPVSFSVAATAAGSTLTYQWQERVGSGGFVTLSNGGIYSGATSATLTISSPTTAMNNNHYRVIVTNCPRTTTSNSAILSVNASPVNPGNPVAAANPACGSTTLNTMTAPAGVTYYWQGNNSSGISTTNPTSATFALNASGTYYVRARNNSSGCWSANSGSVAVTINAAPTATITGSTTICRGSSTTISIALTGTSPWALSWSDGSTTTNVTNIATSPYMFSVSPTSTTTYSVSAVSDASCSGTTSGSAVVTVTTAVSGTRTWNGSVSSNWDLGCNWTPNVVPTASDDVVIPTGRPNYPALNSNSACNNIDLQSGTVSINGYTLTINGVITRNSPGTGTLTGSSSSNLTINGSGNAGTLYFTQASDVTRKIHILTLNRSTGSGGVILGNNLIIGGSTSAQLNIIDGIFDVGNNQLTFHTGNVPIAAGGGDRISVGSGATIQFGLPGNLGGNAFTLPNNTFAAQVLFSNLIINRTNPISFSNQDITLTGSLTLTNGVLDIAGRNLIFQNGNTPIVRTNGTLTVSGGANLTFGTNGNTGGSAFTIPDGTFTTAPTFTNLTLNRLNSLGLGNQNITLTGALNLTAGILSTNTSKVIFSTTATSPAEVSTARIIGEAEMASRSIGTGTINFLGANISANASNNIGNVLINRKTGPTGISTVDAYTSIASLWDINVSNQPATGGGRNVSFSWLSDLDNGKNISAMQVWRQESAPSWQPVGSTQTVANTTLRTTTSVNTTQFSKWTVSDNVNPLPVELLHFKAQAVQNAVYLEWNTVSETDNDYFGLERSADGKYFEEIARVRGAGTSRKLNSYQYSDQKPLSGVTYYRLKQSDFDGKNQYSTIIAVQTIRQVPEYIIPNPTSPSLIKILTNNSSYEHTYSVSVREITGKLVYQQSHAPDSEGLIRIGLKSVSFIPGYHIVTITSPEGTSHHKLLIQ